jgi:histidine ammonia-lyase
MGSIAARKLSTVIANTQRVLAIELLCAAQAIDLLRPLRSSQALERVVQRVRDVVPFAEHDRVLYHDMEAVETIVASGEILTLVSDVIQ